MQKILIRQADAILQLGFVCPTQGGRLADIK